MNKIFNMDAVKGMVQNVEDGSIDLIVTDPPFAIGYKAYKENYNRDETRVINDYYEIPLDRYEEFNFLWVEQAVRVLKRTGSMYLFSGWNNLEIILRVLRQHKFITVNHIIWKYAFGVNCTRKFISSHYHLLYVALDPSKRQFNTCCRFDMDTRIDNGRRNARYVDMEDVWLVNRENWTGKVKTPTKLPGEIVKKILQYSSNPGDLVLDPFSGSGQVPWFCKDLNRRYVAFEISKPICEFSIQRIRENRYMLD